MNSEGRTIDYSGFHKGPGTKFDEADPFACLRNLDLPDTGMHTGHALQVLLGQMGKVNLG